MGGCVCVCVCGRGRGRGTVHFGVPKGMVYMEAGGGIVQAEVALEGKIRLR